MSFSHVKFRVGVTLTCQSELQEFQSLGSVVAVVVAFCTLMPTISLCCCHIPSFNRVGDLLIPPEISRRAATTGASVC